ncbi:MAG: pyrroline-5-carboxylate reductase [Aureliella sp.]
MSIRIGFVGGGQMASALAGGAVAAGFVDESELAFNQPPTPRQAALRERFPVSTIHDEAAPLFADCEKIVLSVKPHILRSIGATLKEYVTPKHLLLSVASGLTLMELSELLGSTRVIRVMPNTPSLVGEGAAAMAAGDGCQDQDVVWVREMMQSVGKVIELTDDQIHAFTGIAGSSPAYIYTVIEALSDGGVAQGLPRHVATEMAAQAVLGAAKMVLETGIHPGALKDQVTSPGGTTIAALRTLESNGVRSAFMEAVASCVQRSREMEKATD